MSSLISALGWTLLHSLWLAGGLAALYWLWLRAAAPTAHQRYVGALAALAGIAVCLMIAFAYNLPDSGQAHAHATVTASSATTLDEVGYLQTFSWRATLARALPWLVLAWGIGVLISAYRLLRGRRALARLVRLAEPLPQHAALLLQLCNELRLSGRVLLRATGLLDVPCVIGLWRPVVLLPIALINGLTPQQLELVLLHELFHVRGWDVWLNALQLVSETILFFHPAVRWLNEEIRDAREQCCDDAVLAQRAAPLAYARVLLSLEAFRHEYAALAPAANGGSLHSRITRIVRSGRLSSVAPDFASKGSALLPVMLSLTLASSLAMFPAPVIRTQILPLTLPKPRMMQTHAVTVPIKVPRAPPIDALLPFDRIAPLEPPSPAKRVLTTRYVFEQIPLGRVEVETSVPNLAPVAEPSPLPQPEILARFLPEFDQLSNLGDSTVFLSFGLTAQGRPTAIESENATAPRALIRAATQALQRWRFAPSDDLADRRFKQSFRFASGQAQAPGNCTPRTGTRICGKTAGSAPG